MDPLQTFPFTSGEGSVKDRRSGHVKEFARELLVDFRKEWVNNKLDHIVPTVLLYWFIAPLIQLDIIIIIIIIIITVVVVVVVVGSHRLCPVFVSTLGVIFDQVSAGGLCQAVLKRVYEARNMVNRHY